MCRFRFTLRDLIPHFDYITGSDFAPSKTGAYTFCYPGKARPTWLLRELLARIELDPRKRSRIRDRAIYCSLQELRDAQ